MWLGFGDGVGPEGHRSCQLRSLGSWLSRGMVDPSKCQEVTVSEEQAREAHGLYKTSQSPCQPLRLL